MNKIIAATAASLVLSACGQHQDNSAAGTIVKAPALHSGILPQHNDSSIRPGDDFNAFVNGAWMAETDIPADRTGTGVGLETHEKSQEDVKIIIEEAASGDHPMGSDEQKVGDFYNAYLDMETRNRLGVTPLQPEFDRIATIDSHAGLARYFARANKIGVDLPFTLQQWADFKNPNYYMMYTSQGGLGLPDREYYFKDDEKSVDIRDAYVQHIEKMFDLAGLENGKEAAAMIMALETRMADKHILKEITRDYVAMYNKVPLDDLTDIMPSFDWDRYLEEAGIKEIDGLVVMMTDYMTELDDILTETNIEDWQTYLNWQVLSSHAHLLTEELDNQNFAFYSTRLSGVETQLPRWKRAVNNVNNHLGEIVGKVYVARHFPPEAKDKMLDLVGNLIKAYEQSITELDWMSEETRAQALDKLAKFTPKIGYPDQWQDYAALEVSADDLVGNLQRSALFVYEQESARQLDEVDRAEWHMTPQTVNAYYSPALNEIVFPAAILQPPFFDLNAEDAVNYGAIGAIIGHEIGHGFDDKGSTFDGDGVMRNWWTEEDRSEFERRTTKLVDQYSAYEPYEGVFVNGEFTLGENIGDLGGLSIALKAYHLSLNGEAAPVIDNLTGDQRVFLGYGQAWRYKGREEAVTRQINTDPHSPREYRVNGVVRNIPEFYEAFNVAEDDALYLPPEERVKIW